MRHMRKKGLDEWQGCFMKYYRQFRCSSPSSTFTRIHLKTPLCCPGFYPVDSPNLKNHKKAQFFPVS